MNEPRVPAAIDLQQKWRLGDQLGAGGFADVYRARSGNGTSAVVKLVRKLPGTHRELLFVDLDDVPNVVPIIDWGESMTIGCWLCRRRRSRSGTTSL